MSNSKTGWGGSWRVKAALLAVIVLTVAVTAFHFSSAVSKSSRSAQITGQHPAAHAALSSTSLSLPLFFEPNQGQTDGRVKFLARGAGYGLFLTSNEAVLDLERSAGKGQAAGSVVRMKLDGASSAARIRGTQPLPGKSSYFIGNDPSKWQRDIPQFSSVEYQSIYPGINLVYYGNQRQLEYDFHVAPGAEPNRIALSFQGASVHLESGDLVVSTAGGDLRFHAPHIYQATDQPGSGAEKAIQGSFRQFADNKIGFTIGDYDHSRELVIDPLLSYSTYLGGSQSESLVRTALDSNNFIYVAGSTTSADFPLPAAPVNPPYQSTLNPGSGAQNLFIAVINPFLAPTQQLVYATYLGGSGQDRLAGVGVWAAIEQGTSGFDIYVAGTTTSTDFPTASVLTPFQAAPQSGTHGFVTRLNPADTTNQLRYSTYLAGTGTDTLTGLAIDTSGNAYVTGTTTSTNVNVDVDSGFPSTPNGFQICPFQPAQSGGNPCPVTTGPTQFFASEVNTAGTGTASVLYSTYFGGGYTNGPGPAVVTGGGIAVDPPDSNSTGINMYFTGTTNMPAVPGPNKEAPFPAFYNAYQSCLDESGITSCTLASPTNPDAFLVKINPSQSQPNAPPAFATYLGGSGNDSGTAVAVDTSSNAYVTGATNSSDWLCSNACTPGPYPFAGQGVNTNAFIAEVGNESNLVFPLNFFTWIGGSGPDSGQAIVVDTIGTAHVTGSTSSNNLPLTDAIQSYQGSGDAFVALISTTMPTVSGPPPGDYLTYLGGSAADQGSGIALDQYGAVYVVGTTRSPNFPPANPPNPLQASLKGVQNAFVAKLSGNSNIVTSNASGSPSPTPLPAGTAGTFTFNITNAPFPAGGGDPASNVIFEATVPTTGLASLPTATVSSGVGTCSTTLGQTIVCTIGSLAVNSMAQVQVVVTPASPAIGANPTITVSGTASANGGPFGGTVGQTANVTDFAIAAAPGSQTIQNGQLATFSVTLGADYPQGYNATITLSQTSSPAIVTSPAPTFVINPVTLLGVGTATTQLNIQTVARPVTTGGLLRRSSFYAAWLPIGGLSLVGLGIGAGRKRRRWLVGALLGLVAGLILLQPACSSSSTPVVTTGGTAAGQYTITITGAASTGASHNLNVTLNVT